MRSSGHTGRGRESQAEQQPILGVSKAKRARVSGESGRRAKLMTAHRIRFWGSKVEMSMELSSKADHRASSNDA
jgi:hypothetical protein